MRRSVTRSRFLAPHDHDVSSLSAMRSQTVRPRCWLRERSGTPAHPHIQHPFHPTLKTPTSGRHDADHRHAETGQPMSRTYLSGATSVSDPRRTASVGTCGTNRPLYRPGSVRGVSRTMANEKLMTLADLAEFLGVPVA